MKTDCNGSSTNPNRDVLIPIRFAFKNPNAVSVCVAGTFNEWRPRATPLIRGSGGHWGKFTALFAGTYEYCLVVDERWILDPNNQRSVANPFGGRNSLLTVSHSTREPELLNADYLPAPSPAAIPKGLIDKTIASIAPDAPLLSPVILDLPESTVLHTINTAKPVTS